MLKAVTKSISFASSSQSVFRRIEFRLQGSVENHTLCRVVSGAKLHTDARRLQLVSKAPNVAEGEQVEKPHLTNLRNRGLFNLELFRNVKTTEVKDVQVVDNGENVQLTWGDGHVSRFHSLWLRHSCYCEKCRLDYNGMVDMNFSVIDKDTKITSAYMEGNEVLVVKFEAKEGEKFHESPIPTHWLRHYCYSEKAKKARAAQREMVFFKEKTIPEMDYTEIDTDAGMYKWLTHLSERGICLLKNVPVEEGMVAKVAERIAPVQHSLYGEIQDIVSTPEPINPGLSADRLDYHTDQIHYESPTGLQLFHCLQFDKEIEGGENNFVDVHEVANALRKERPDLFDTLVRIPVTIHTVHYNRPVPINIEIERPLFILNHKKDLVSVTWNPYMLAPVQTEEKDMKPFYEAHSYFHKIISNWPTYTHRLQPGDLMSVNNRRVMHSREAFKNINSKRFLQVCYVEISEFQSKVQILHNLLGDGRLARRCGSSNFQ